MVFRRPQAMCIGCVIALFIAAHSMAGAQLLFTLSPETMVMQQGDMFELSAQVENTNRAGGASYAINSYDFAVSPNGLHLPADLNDDGTWFYAKFQRKFGPGDIVAGPFLDFAVGSGAKPGSYRVMLFLLDPANTSLAQQQFILSIQAKPGYPVPETGFPLLLGNCCVVMALIRWRYRKVAMRVPT